MMTLSLTSLPYYLSLASLALVGPSAAIALFLVIVTTLKAYNEHGILPRALPWSGKQKQLFASLRANIRGATQSEKLFTEGYYKVCPKWFSCSIHHIESVSTVFTKGGHIRGPHLDE